MAGVRHRAKSTSRTHPGKVRTAVLGGQGGREHTDTLDGPRKQDWRGTRTWKSRCEKYPRRPQPDGLCGQSTARRNAGVMSWPLTKLPH